MQIDTQHIPVQTILPQLPPYIMVDKMLYYQLQKAESELLVSANNYMVKDGFFTTGGIVENMAQTCALHIGYYNKYILQNPVKIGYVAAIPSFTLHRLPPVGSTVRTYIEVLYTAMGMSKVQATMYVCNHTEVDSLTSVTEQPTSVTELVEVPEPTPSVAEQPNSVPDMEDPETLIASAQISIVETDMPAMHQPHTP